MQVGEAHVCDARVCDAEWSTCPVWWRLLWPILEDGGPWCTCLFKLVRQVFPRVQVNHGVRDEAIMANTGGWWLVEHLSQQWPTAVPSRSTQCVHHYITHHISHNLISQCVIKVIILNTNRKCFFFNVKSLKLKYIYMMNLRHVKGF